jgi:hypothetical protein
MSSTQSDDSGSIDVSNLKPSDSVQKLQFVGRHRASKMAWETIGGLAKTTVKSLYEDSDLSISRREAVKIMTQAKDVAGGSIDSEYADDVSDDDAGEDVPDDVEADGSVQELSVSDMDEEPDGGIPEFTDDDVEKVGLVVGMATSDADQSVLRDKISDDHDKEEVMKQFAPQLVEAGLDPEGEGWTPVLLRSGMGRREIVKYLDVSDEHDTAMQVKADHDAHPSYSEAYSARDEEFVSNTIDGLIIIERGEYAGKFAAMAIDENLPVQSPPEPPANDTEDVDVDMETV